MLLLKPNRKQRNSSKLYRCIWELGWINHKLQACVAGESAGASSCRPVRSKCVRATFTTAVSRSLWLFDPRAADIQAVEGMKSSIFWVLVGCLWVAKKKRDRKEEKRKRNGLRRLSHRPSSCLYGGLNSQILWCTRVMLLLYHCWKFVLSKDQDTNESVQSWKVISIFPRVLIFIAMKF